MVGGGRGGGGYHGGGGCSTKGGNSGSSPLRIRTRSYQEVKAYHKRKHTRAAERTFVCEASSCLEPNIMAAKAI